MAAGPTKIKTPFDASGIQVWEWTGLLNGEKGAPLAIPQYPDKTFQAYGTFGTGGTVTWEGTNDEAAAPADARYGALAKQDGTDLTQTTAKPSVCQQAPYQVRPNVTAGDGTTSLTARVVMTTPR